MSFSISGFCLKATICKQSGSLFLLFVSESARQDNNDHHKNPKQKWARYLLFLFFSLLKRPFPEQKDSLILPAIVWVCAGSVAKCTSQGDATRLPVQRGTWHHANCSHEEKGQPFNFFRMIPLDAAYVRSLALERLMLFDAVHL